MKTIIQTGTFFLAFILAGFAHAGGLEHNVDRPGGGGYSVPNVGTPQHCQQLCQRDRNCKAFTWVRPGLQGPGGRCWLKTSVTRRARNNCCVSGVKARRTSSCKWVQQTSSYRCMCYSNRSRKWHLSNPNRCPKTKPSVKYLDPKVRKDKPSGSCVFGQC